MLNDSSSSLVSHLMPLVLAKRQTILAVILGALHANETSPSFSCCIVDLHLHVECEGVHELRRAGLVKIDFISFARFPRKWCICVMTDQ